VGYKVFHGSTLVALRKVPLIDAITGAPDGAFPLPWLRSGIISGRGLGPSQQKFRSLSENLTENACLHHSLFPSENLPQIIQIVNLFCDFLIKNFENSAFLAFVYISTRNLFLC
jgi:hypothetical protein